MAKGHTQKVEQNLVSTPKAKGTKMPESANREPSREEIGEVMQEIAATYKLRRTSESRQLAVEGLIPGVDAPGKVENGDFHPDQTDAQPSYWRETPWWMIVNVEDLDRVVLGIQGRIMALKLARDRINADLKAQEDRLLRTINYYSDLLPECPPDAQSKSAIGPLTRGTYRNQPGRTPRYILKDRAAAAAAGLLRTVERLEPLPNGELHALAQATPTGLLPGYEYIAQPPVSFTPAKDTSQAPAAPELEPPVW